MSMIKKIKEVNIMKNVKNVLKLLLIAQAILGLMLDVNTMIGGITDWTSVLYWACIISKDLFDLKNAVQKK